MKRVYLEKRNGAVLGFSGGILRFAEDGTGAAFDDAATKQAPAAAVSADAGTGASFDNPRAQGNILIDRLRQLKNEDKAPTPAAPATPLPPLEVAPRGAKEPPRATKAFKAPWVKEFQKKLLGMGINLGKWKDDGIYGGRTRVGAEEAAKIKQISPGVDARGYPTPALLKALDLPEGLVPASEVPSKSEKPAEKPVDKSADKPATESTEMTPGGEGEYLANVNINYGGRDILFNLVVWGSVKLKWPRASDPPTLQQMIDAQWSVHRLIDAIELASNGNIKFEGDLPTLRGADLEIYRDSWDKIFHKIGDVYNAIDTGIQTAIKKKQNETGKTVVYVNQEKVLDKIAEGFKAFLFALQDLVYNYISSRAEDETHRGKEKDLLELLESNDTIKQQIKDLTQPALTEKVKRIGRILSSDGSLFKKYMLGNDTSKYYTLNDSAGGIKNNLNNAIGNYKEQIEKILAK